MLSKAELRTIVYERFPRIPWLRKRASRGKVARLCRFLPDEHIVKMALQNEESRAAFVLQRAGLFPDKAKRLNDEMASIRRSLSSGMSAMAVEEFDAVADDVKFCYFAYGFSPFEYLGYGFRRFSDQERREYISELESIIYGYRLNDIADMMIFMDKVKTYEKFGKYFQRDACRVSSKKDYRAFESFVDKHPVFVAKDAMSSRGRGIQLVRTDLSASREEIFEGLLQRGDVLIEELIHQSDAMAKFNRSSVNTVRCITLNTPSNIKIIHVFFKAGRAGSFVDNGGAGGIIVGVDCLTGILATDGIDELGIRYDRHPDSGAEFIGQQLPDWRSLTAMCYEMSSILPSVKMIGWDFAHTDDGWVAVEGNGLTEVIGPQSTFARGIKMEFEEQIRGIELQA